MKEKFKYCRYKAVTKQTYSKKNERKHKHKKNIINLKRSIKKTNFVLSSQKYRFRHLFLNNKFFII